jgi:hypothetical protein
MSAARRFIDQSSPWPLQNHRPVCGEASHRKHASLSGCKRRLRVHFADAAGANDANAKGHEPRRIADRDFSYNARF